MPNCIGIVDLSLRIRRETIAVEPPTKLFAVVLVGEAHDLGVAVQRLAEVGLQLFVGVTEERGIAVVHRQVVEIVERREYGKLGESRHARHHHEANVGGFVLDLDVEIREFLTDVRGKLDIGQSVTHWRIIFVNEHDHGLARPFRECTDGPAEVCTRGNRRVPRRLHGGKNLLKTGLEVRHESLKGLGLNSGKVEVEDGILGPVVVQLVDGKSLEKLALAAKDTFQRGEHEGFTETPRTRDKEEFPTDINPIDQAIERFCLVHINVPLLP